MEEKLAEASSQSKNAANGCLPELFGALILTASFAAWALINDRRDDLDFEDLIWFPFFGAGLGFLFREWRNRPQ